MTPNQKETPMTDSVPERSEMHISDNNYFYYELSKGEGQAIIENRNSSERNGADQLTYELLSPDGVHFYHYSNNTPEKKIFYLDTRNPFVQLNFSISSKTNYRSADDVASFAEFGNYEYNILYLPACKSVIEWNSDDRIETFSLNILPEIFLQYLPVTHPLAERFSKFKTEDAVSISEYNLPVTPRIKAILYEILNCPLSSHYKRLYLKAKSVELLLMLFSHYEEYKLESVKAAPELREIDISRMQHAREILHKNIENPCSLIDLAHHVGTNENYLKKHFKKVFGHTVYGYVQELRMEQAKQLLSKGDYNINEIAKRSGYKYTHHFISAFKKYFGYAPVKIRNLFPAIWMDMDINFLYDLAAVV